MLEVTDARVVVPGGRAILRGARLRATPGRLVAVVGPNGAGKSTLVRAAAGIQPLAAGEVRWNDRPAKALGLRRLARIRAFLPQRPSVPAGVTVRDVVELGRAPHIGPLRRPSAADHDAVDRALERTDTAEFAQRRLATLSGGELQRVQIAIAIAQQTPALLADEPTSSLDLGAASSVARLLRRLAVDDGLAVVMVCHDLALASAIADEVVVVANGATVATGAPDTILTTDRLAEIWHVEAGIEHSADGRTALRVSWLAEPPALSRSTEDRT